VAIAVVLARLSLRPLVLLLSHLCFNLKDIKLLDLYRAMKVVGKPSEAVLGERNMISKTERGNSLDPFPSSQTDISFVATSYYFSSIKRPYSSKCGL